MVEFLVQGYRTKNLGGAGSEPRTAHDFLQSTKLIAIWIYGGRPMRLTSKGRYAVRAMLDLTTHSNGNPVRLQEISTRQNISLHYLEQLFRKLRNGQAVKSVRGPGGGYVLARSMDQITIKDILDCVGENINPAKDILGTEAETSNTVEFHLSKNYFQNLGIIMREYLTTTTLGDLMRKSSDVQEEITRQAAQNAQPSGATGTSSEASNTESTQQEQNGLNSSIRNPIGEVNQ
jgi:Rrf2 family iron-sulfur cluster assembly transcriptional regulator